jgi:hypothetical protein
MTSPLKERQDQITPRILWQWSYAREAANGRYYPSSADGGMNSPCRCWARRSTGSDQATDLVMKGNLVAGRTAEG